MKKQTAKTKIKRIKFNNRFWKVGGLTLLVVFVFAQLGFDAHVGLRYLAHTSPQSEPMIATMISRAIDGLYRPVPVEPITGKQYIPQARIVIPAQDSTLPQLLYLYTPNEAGMPGEIQITSTNLLSVEKSQMLNDYNAAYTSHFMNKEGVGMRALFERVPSLQACARGVQIFEKPQRRPGESTWINQGTKKLRDGRTLHFYTETSCKSPDILTEILGLAKKAQSY